MAGLDETGAAGLSQPHILGESARVIGPWPPLHRAGGRHPRSPCLGSVLPAQRKPPAPLPGGFVHVQGRIEGQLTHEISHDGAKSNWPSRIRTWINGSKVRCPAIGRRASQGRLAAAGPSLPMLVGVRGSLQHSGYLLTPQSVASSAQSRARRGGVPRLRRRDRGRGERPPA